MPKMVRTAACSDKLKDQWDEEEDDDKIVSYASKQQGMPGNWTSFSKRSGVQRRNGKKWSCGGNREPDGKHKSFTPQEEELVIQLHAAIGSRWPIIAQQLPGRTENDVKTLWNSKLRKKLSAMGIDPVTHKPFSQILADYGSIGAFPKARTRFTSLSRDLKNATILRSQQACSNSNQFPPLDAKVEPQPLDPHHSLDLYSQLQAVNLVTDTSNITKNENVPQCYIPECGSSSEISSSSFSWSDFLLEDEFLPTDISVHENATHGDNVVVECVEDIQGKKNGVVERKNGANVGSDKNNFEQGSCSDSSSFVEAMLETQDEMFAQLSGFLGEPFYY